MRDLWRKYTKTCQKWGLTANGISHGNCAYNSTLLAIICYNFTLNLISKITVSTKVVKPMIKWPLTLLPRLLTFASLCFVSPIFHSSQCTTIKQRIECTRCWRVERTRYIDCWVKGDRNFKPTSSLSSQYQLHKQVHSIIIKGQIMKRHTLFSRVQ